MTQLEEFMNREAELRFQDIIRESEQTGRPLHEVAQLRGLNL